MNGKAGEAYLIFIQIWQVTHSQIGQSLHRDTIPL
jgi:hypothetical protein